MTIFHVHSTLWTCHIEGSDYGAQAVPCIVKCAERR